MIFLYTEQFQCDIKVTSYLPNPSLQYFIVIIEKMLKSMVEKIVLKV